MSPDFRVHLQCRPCIDATVWRPGIWIVPEDVISWMKITSQKCMIDITWKKVWLIFTVLMSQDSMQDLQWRPCIDTAVWRPNIWIVPEECRVRLFPERKLPHKKVWLIWHGKRYGWYLQVLCHKILCRTCNEGPAQDTSSSLVLDSLYQAPIAEEMFKIILRKYLRHTNICIEEIPKD